VNLLPSTSMVTAPSAVGVNVIVYSVAEILLRLPKVPLVFVISALTKSVVASLDSKVSVSVASLVVEPSITGATPLVAVITIVGAVPS